MAASPPEHQFSAVMSDALPRLTHALADRYRIERELGAGGMATVYLARDVKFDREVALKVLRPELGAVLGPERFLEEIRITARLDHPHILTLIDSGVADGLLYYVMPYVRGESLRERLRRETQLGLDDAFAIAKQVASALDFAHRHGVVHRDLKPENILLQEGEAMLADFGIALAVSESGGERITQTGLSLGTPGYMSPEQATGDRTIDARSDVYSLAAVVYEMISGELPIRGATAQAMIARLLTEAPTPLHVLRASVSPEAEAAVARALAKTPSDRFATAGEFVAALSARAPSYATPEAARASSVAPAVPSRPRSRALMVGVALLLIAGAVAGWRWTRLRPVVLVFDRVESLTNDPGLEIQPDVSPQGNLVAYAAGGLGSMRVYVRPITGGRAIALAEDGAPQQSMPRWSPTGDRVAFQMGGGISVAPALGGTVSTLVSSELGRGIRSLTWSQDGSEISWSRDDSLFATVVSDGTTRAIGAARGLHSCDWSSSGRWIACASGNSESVGLTPTFGNAAPSNLVVIPAAGGEAVVISGGGFEHLSPRFLPGEEVVLFISNRQGPRDLYSARIDASGRLLGEPYRLTTGLAAHSFAISRDGSRITYSSYDARANVWSVPFRPDRLTRATPATAVELTTGTQLIESVELSFDGKWLLYVSNLRGNFDIWRISITGGTPERLTDHPANEFAPSLSPDGREVTYHSWRTGSRDIEVKSLDGSAPVPVTATADPRSESYPMWSPQGDAIAYLDQGVGGGVHLVRRANGKWETPAAVVPNLVTVGSRVDWAPEGRKLLALDPGALLSLEIGATTTVDTLLVGTASTPLFNFCRWAADARSVVCKAHDALAQTSFWIVEPGTNRARLIVSFPDARWQSARLDFDLDAERIYFPVEQRESDVQTVGVRRP